MLREESDHWPFDQPRHCATFTTPQVMRMGMPVLLVSHDADDHGWQFLHGDVSDDDQPMLVALSEVVRTDPTLLEVADLPFGWQAIRSYRGGPWRRVPKAPESGGAE
jgi:hypothetical protein